MPRSNPRPNKVFCGRTDVFFSLQNAVAGRDHSLPQDVSETLELLAKLSKQENAKVALRARQVLIAAHQPPYELRHNQVRVVRRGDVGVYRFRRVCTFTLKPFIHQMSYFVTQFFSAIISCRNRAGFC